MKSMTSLLYAAPAAVFLVWLALRFVAGRVGRKRSAVLAVSSHAMAVGLLVIGAAFHRIHHVRLEAVEAEVGGGAGPEWLSIGDVADAAGAGTFLSVPGLPADALRLTADGDGLRIQPGSGYDRRLLVKSGGRWVPLEASGIPRLEPLEGGDEIIVALGLAGGDAVWWRLGPGPDDLTVPAGRERWIGGNGEGRACVPGFPDEVLGLRVEGRELVVKRGPGWGEGFGAWVDMAPVDFGSADEARMPYAAGVTRLRLAKPEPLAGTAVFTEGTYGQWAAVDWQSASPERLPVAFQLASDRPWLVGGTAGDAFFVNGLPEGALEMSVLPEGRVRLALTEKGAEAKAEGRLAGDYPQEAGPGDALDIGTPGAPGSGRVRVETVEWVEAAGERKCVARCQWEPASTVHWTLPNRKVTLPLMDVRMEVVTRRPWQQEIFPLARLTGRQSGLTTSLVSAPGHPRLLGTSLLVLDPGVAVRRHGQLLPRAQQAIGRLESGQPLEIHRISAEEMTTGGGSEGVRPPVVSAPGSVRRVALYDAVSLVRTGRGKAARTSIRVDLGAPEVRSVDKSRLADDLEMRDPEAELVEFGLNEPPGLSSRLNQVRFPQLGRFYRHTGADVTLNWLSFDVRDDDGQRRELDFGAPFSVGGPRKLHLRIDKLTLPAGTIAWLGAAALLTVLLHWRWLGEGAWASLLFGTGFIVCSRVLFGHAVLVNAPYDAEVRDVAVVAAVAVPVVLAAARWGTRRLLGGAWSERFGRKENGVGPGMVVVAAVVLLAVRLGLLFAGFKEGVVLGGSRVALSIIFVPAHAVLFALTCAWTVGAWRRRGRMTGRTTAGCLFSAGVLLGCQMAASVMVSDLGGFLYCLPQMLVLAAVGVAGAVENVSRALRDGRAAERTWPDWVAAALSASMTLPLVLTVLLFVQPRVFIDRIPGLAERMSSDEIISSGSLLRLLQFVDKDYLIGLGTDQAERIAQDHALMENYSRRGPLGEGWLQVHVVPAKAETALNDSVAAVFLFAQFGTVGALAMALAYLAVAAGAWGALGGRPLLPAWVALAAAGSFVVPSLYMIASNNGLVPFTGRNMYLLGLNSRSDVLEAGALLALVAGACAWARWRAEQRETSERPAADGLKRIPEPVTARPVRVIRLTSPLATLHYA